MRTSAAARGSRAALFGITALTAACGRPPSVPPPVAALPPATTPLRVSVLWADPVDLDLYVTDPAQEAVYFANSPSGSGGRLERDERCGGDTARGRDADVRIETIAWRTPTPGRYRVGLDFSDTCGLPARPVAYRVVADVAGRRLEDTGSLRPAEFRYVVLEFDLGEDDR